MQKTYPQNTEEWRRAIKDGLGWDSSETQDAYQAGKLPFDELEQWLRTTFQQGYSPDFFPALQRNIKGLVAWVYCDEGEPYWPGSDNE